jgi:hypothetical protein
MSSYSFKASCFSVITFLLMSFKLAIFYAIFHEFLLKTISPFSNETINAFDSKLFHNINLFTYLLLLYYKGNND